MKDPKITKELIDKYYDLLSKKGDFGSLLSDNFLLTGTISKDSRGKEAYTKNIFFSMIKNLKIRDTIIESDRACIIVNYELTSLKGNNFKTDVVEIWKVKEEKLDSVAIYFDTAFFQKAMA